MPDTLINNAGGKYSLDAGQIKVAGVLTVGTDSITVERDYGNGYKLTKTFSINVVGASAFALDFTTGVLPAGVTASGGVNGSRFASNGFLDTSEAAPRFDYTSAGISRGILVEPARTNMTLRSTNFNDAYWTNNGVTMTSGVITGPDNTASGWSMIAGGGTYPNIRQAFQANDRGSRTVFAKLRDAGTHLDMWFNSSPNRGAIFDLSLGTVIVATNVTASITPVGGGWFLCEANTSSFGPNSTALGPTQQSVINSQAAAISGSGVYLAFPQTELEFVPATTYILNNTGAGLTRTADAISFTVPTGVSTLTYTFDNDATQAVSVAPGAYTIPTNLNRSRIKTIVGS